jgi:hypothetical protein
MVIKPPPETWKPRRGCAKITLFSLIYKKKRAKHETTLFVVNHAAANRADGVGKDDCLKSDRRCLVKHVADVAITTHIVSLSITISIL